MLRFLSICLLVFFLGISRSDAQAVYKTPSGKKYHLATCRMVENVSRKITVQEALALGLDPCKICNPQAGSASSENKKVNPPATTVQCKGTTKAGTRCKHRTSMSNGYCFQHTP